MTLLEFSIDLPSSYENLFKIITDFEKFSDFLPVQLKQIKIITNNNNLVTTEETLFFSSIIKKQIIQQTVHELVSDKNIKSKIINGPAKGTLIEVILEPIKTGTHIRVKLDLKLKFYLRILTPIIKKEYKMVFTGIFYKINNVAMGYNQNSV